MNTGPKHVSGFVLVLIVATLLVGFRTAYEVTGNLIASFVVSGALTAAAAVAGWTKGGSRMPVLRDPRTAQQIPQVKQGKPQGGKQAKKQARPQEWDNRDRDSGRDGGYRWSDKNVRTDRRQVPESVRRWADDNGVSMRELTRLLAGARPQGAPGGGWQPDEDEDYDES